jgi:hypothetical protein
MSHALQNYDLSAIVKTLVTEDDEPVDNLFSEKQQRLLTEPLYSCWTPPPSEEDEPASTTPRPFLAAANVGVFFAVHQPPLVPDMFLSLDVQPGAEWDADECRSYFVWEFGKVPDAVVEVVSNREGNELGSKLRRYAEWGIPYYVVFDPFLELSQTKLTVYEFGFGKRYRPRDNWNLPLLGLNLSLWEGEFEGIHDTWLRWCDAQGQLIPTGKERADSEAQRADREAQRANSEAQRADSEAQRAENEAQRAARAETEVAQLRAELARLQSQ